MLEAGRPGETYNVGGWNEKPNIEIVHTVCAPADELRPRDGQSYRQQITYVKDRPGTTGATPSTPQDRTRTRLAPAETFETGIRKTVQWYLDHPNGWRRCAAATATGWPNNTRGGQHEHPASGQGGQVGWELQRSLAVLGNVTALGRL